MILLLEDDPAIAQTIAFALQREGFAVEHCAWLQHELGELAQAMDAMRLRLPSA